jgi:hypothetical protein
VGKSSHVELYFKEQRALRTETTINNPKNFYVANAMPNLSYSICELGSTPSRDHARAIAPPGHGGTCSACEPPPRRLRRVWS